MAEQDADKLRALAIIEEARQSHKFCCIHLYSDYDYCWEVEWVLADVEGHETHRTKAHDILLDAVLEFQRIAIK